MVVGGVDPASGIGESQDMKKRIAMVLVLVGACGGPDTASPYLPAPTAAPADAQVRNDAPFFYDEPDAPDADLSPTPDANDRFSEENGVTIIHTSVAPACFPYGPGLDICDTTLAACTAITTKFKIKEKCSTRHFVACLKRVRVGTGEDETFCFGEMSDCTREAEHSKRGSDFTNVSDCVVVRHDR